MTTERRDFDAVAASWDDNPTRVKLVQAVTVAIRQQAALNKNMRVLDFGCGTGLLSMLLQPDVASVTGVDSSPGMLEVFRQKSQQHGLRGMDCQLVDIEQGGQLTGQYDLVVSNMALHHIQDTAGLLPQLARVLAPGGQLALSDLDLDDGLFHGDNTGVFHFGFDRQQLAAALEKLGLTGIQHTTATSITKTVAGGYQRTFTVFLLSARKKP